MKIKIKNSFWEKDLTTQRDKLIDIIFLGTIFFLCNIIYNIYTEKIIMLTINSIIFILYTIIQISYNKRKKNNGTN